MKKLTLFTLSLLFAIFVFNGCNETLTEISEVDDVELKSANSGTKSYIVVLNDNELDTELSKLKGYEKKQEAVKTVSDKILKRAGITDGEVEHVYGTALKGFSVKIAPGQLKKLQDDTSVKYIEEDQIISFGNPKTEGNVTAMAQTLPWGIARVNGGVNGVGKTAWIIDTGIDLTHPDLNVDASRGISFVTRVTSPNDDNGHGSHVAGTIAAKDNTEGVIGVASGATVVPVKVLDRKGSGTTSGVIAGIDYVAANGLAGDVVNMSLGGGVSTSLDDAVIDAASKGVVFVLAAGNESDNANNHSPARVNGSNIYTISAFGEGDVWASFSNYGNPPVEWCEPGVSILSCYKGGGYATMSGTSMATPHAAGLLLLGKIKTDGYVKNDPDGNPDPIKVYDGTIAPPPANIAPTANFSFTTNNLTVDFIDSSIDSDGSISSRSWNFGDGSTSTSTNPSHTYTSAGIYSVTLTVTDNVGVTGNVIKDVTVTQSTAGNIVLTAVISGNKVKKATLSWSGASGATVEIYKDGTLLATVPNSGSFSENLGKITSGSIEYQIRDETGAWSYVVTAIVN